MTETQAKSGTAGASTTPVDEEAAGGGSPATGRAAVGRAAVPADPPSPKFTRAPGMPPPPGAPDKPSDDQQPAATKPEKKPASGSAGSGTATAGSGDSGRTQPSAGRSTAGDPTRTAAGDGGRSAATGARPAGGPAGATTTAFRPGSVGDRSGPVGDRSGPVGDRPGPVGGAAAVGAARVTEAVRAARSTVNSAASRGPRRARLNLKRIDPWSVMKFSGAVSVVLFIVVVVATSVLYLALDAMGVFESVNSSLADLISAGGGPGAETFRITAKGVIGTSALIGLVNVVLFTALATLGAFIYNVCADLVGGIELTLAERD
ncbi:DUF3566 domain-containing protein [Plantactinospora sp. GCM10030261]|uniref:DUF3566 domain-containing protein n=1 Tax=Plantactinospora sp. GCM10030261 TaxID=3273420 RepID=UPI00360D7FD7